MMNECTEIGPMLGAFQDGELEPPEMREVARHLAQCAACEAELAQHEALALRLREAVTVPELDGFAEGVMSRIAELSPPIRARLLRRFELAREQITTALSLGALALATAAIIAVIVTPYASRLTEHGTQIAQTTAEHVAQVADAIPPVTNSRAVISSLESHVKSVAVWSEPQTQTTVIWIPDQP
jgi:anti-sigma factor RsiW